MTRVALVVEHPDPINVYDGLRRLGCVVAEAAAEWLAENDDGEVIGRFPTRQAAIAAIVANVRRVL